MSKKYIHYEVIILTEEMRDIEGIVDAVELENYIDCLSGYGGYGNVTS